MAAEIVLLPGRDRSVKQRHPWIYSGAIQRVSGDPQPGDMVAVIASDGEKLGQAAFSPVSQIRARMWTWDPETIIDKAFLRERMERAIRWRDSIISKGTNAARLIYAESDGIPGLIVDGYADHLVVQCLSAGSERWKQEIVENLVDLCHPEGIYERSDVDVRRLEGLAEKSGLLWGKEPPDEVIIEENGLRFLVDIKRGQKTGFFLDQRENRNEVLTFVGGKELLNCFCYTGAFTVYGMKGKAVNSVSIDSSEEALALAKRNLELNGFREGQVELIEGDVFQLLRKFRDTRRQFDVIVLDPPKFAANQAQVNNAARAYKDINLLAFKLLRPGGILFTFSCSGGIDTDLFQKIVAGAALDAGVDAQIVKRLTQAQDHPVALRFPESAYLKGLICRLI